MGSSTEPINPGMETIKSGTEDIKGIVNVLGKVEGHGNGLINFGVASPDGTGSGQPTEEGGNYDAKTNAVKELAKAVASLDDGQNAPTNGKKVRGLSNLAEGVEGNGNAGINFGNLNWGDSAKKKGATCVIL